MLFGVILLSSFLNHLIYGNSNTTMSQYEAMKNIRHEQIKRKYSKSLADYMYDRIQFYQDTDGYYERTLLFWNIYEKLIERANNEN